MILRGSVPRLILKFLRTPDMHRNHFRHGLTATLLLASVFSCGGDGGAPTSVLPGCEGQDVGPTTHSVVSLSSETWTRCGSPHLILQTFDARASAAPGSPIPTITIEAGAEVRLYGQASINVGVTQPAILRIMGTAAQPVTFVRANPVIPWGGIHLEGMVAGSELHHVTFEGCGVDRPGCLIVEGDPATAEPYAVLFDNVTFRDAMTNAIVLLPGAAFASGSTGLTVTRADGHPLIVSANAVGSIPSEHSFSLNELNVVGIGGSGVVTRTQTWRRLGVPYAYLPIGVLEIDAAFAGSPSPTLTIAPGTTLNMSGETRVRVGQTHGGALIAAGTASEPIVFTGWASAPSPGHWRGIDVGTNAASTTRFDFVTVEFAGGGMGHPGIDDANILMAVDLGPMITNSVIRSSAKCGITRAGSVGSFTTDFTAPGLGNTFTANVQAPQCGPY